MSTGTVAKCGYCGRPVVGMAVWAGSHQYHPECTRGPGYDPGQRVFQPTPVTAEEIRQIIREELQQALGCHVPPEKE